MEIIDDMTKDGKSVLYTSDTEGYCNVYLAQIGDFDALPDLPADK
jgi:Tol biopolymer transport system component